MNIREAAAQLERTIRAYTMRTKDGVFAVPKAAQRPVYLEGPPGVGKTAVVEQVARRLGVGFVAYTMTHHTRQSAIGLPVIEHRSFGGEEHAVTEYTMSEILASVWEQVEKRSALNALDESTAAAQGILFLDEINCVSETLMPAMLQFLQYKTFGRHGLPEGWVVVCAGNPARYNRFAREFDPVVQDRIRMLSVEPDLEAWQRFALEHGVHPAIRSYLRLRPEDFYAADGDHIVTARSWTDLSDMMRALEQMGEPIDNALFGQYLRCVEVAERFGMYYNLCAGEMAQDMLDGVLCGEVSERWGRLSFDEALYAVLLLSGRLQGMAAECAQSRRRAERLSNFADGVAREKGEDPAKVCVEHLARMEHALEVRVNVGTLDDAEEAEERRQLSMLRSAVARAVQPGGKPLEVLCEAAESAAKPAMDQQRKLASAMDCALDFVENSISDANVRLIFLKDLETHEPSRRFLINHAPERFEELLRRHDPNVRAERLRRKMEEQ